MLQEQLLRRWGSCGSGGGTATCPSSRPYADAFPPDIEHTHRQLTARHRLMMQPFFMRPGPPNFLMSWQNWQVLHSFLQQAAQRLHLTRLRRRAEMEERLMDLRGLWGLGPKRGRASGFMMPTGTHFFCSGSPPASPRGSTAPPAQRESAVSLSTPLEVPFLLESMFSMSALSKHLSPKKMSPCFPDNTQFSYISRFWGVGGISQNTCRGPRMWYQTEVPPKSMWKSVKQPCTLMR
ncbi:hypothetical protein F7725_010242, partial [Dissostichus mawsoni]